MKKMKILSFLIAAILTLGLFAACSGAAPSSKSQAPDLVYAQTTAATSRNFSAEYAGVAPSPEAKDDGSGQVAETGGFVADAARKIIRNAGLSIETLEFEDSIAALKALVGKYSGYIQNSSESGISAVSQKNQSRYASFSLRIPAESLDAFLSGAGEVGNILNTSVSSDEITDQYYDSEARLSSLKTQENRLLSILEKADKLEDVIELEKALSQARYEIESITSTLRRYDSLIAYSTVSVELREVSNLQTVAPLPKSLSERIAQRFSHTTETLKEGAASFIVWFVGDLPLIVVNLAIFAVILFVFLAVLRRLGLLKKRGSALPPADKPSESNEKKQ